MLTPETTCLGCFHELNKPKGVCPHCGFDNATVANEAHQLEAGSILAGTYLIGKVLGQGGFGITYVGWDLNLEIKVAIKEYYPEGCVTRDTHTHVSVLTYAGPKDAFFQKGKERFVGEARALAKFSGDSGVVGVRAFFYENGTAYIVMDFVEGETLKAYAARMGGKLPSAQVLSLFQPLIRSLARVHESGLLHRDISPDNIMLKSDGTLALLDFGAARQISVAGEHSNTINVKHGFAPEEQYRTRGEQGPWTDIYALCATMYRLTTGVTPTEALDRMANDEELTPPSAYGADFTPEQERALMHGLALRANARTRDLKMLAQELYASPAQPQPFFAPAPTLQVPVPMPETVVTAPVPTPAAPMPETVVTAPAPTPAVFAPMPSDSAEELESFAQPKRVPQQEYSVTVPVIESAPQTAPISTNMEDAVQVNKRSDERVADSDESEADQDQGKNAEEVKSPNKRILGFAIAALAIVILVIVIALLNTPPTPASQSTVEQPQVTEAPGPVVADEQSVPEITLAPVQVVEEDPSKLVDWQDPTLETGIRKALGKSNGEDVTIGDLSNIKCLVVAGDTIVINDYTIWPLIDNSNNTYSMDFGGSWQPIPDQTLLLSDLKYFHNLDTLRLVATGVSAWDTLCMCSNLNSLSLNNCGDIDLNWFRGIRNLQYLDIANCSKLTIQGGGQGSTVRIVTLSSCEKIDCAELAEYKNIESLSIYSCTLEASEELGGLTKLKELRLRDTQVSSADFLVNLKNLETLGLYESTVTELPSLQQMTKLTLLDLSCSSLDNADMFQLAELRGLSMLSIEGCNVSDLSFLRDMDSLTFLSFLGTSVQDISPIQNLKQLRILRMGNTGVTDINVLTTLTSLENLAIFNLKISDLSLLTGLPLKAIEVDSSQEAKIREMFPNAEITVW